MVDEVQRGVRGRRGARSVGPRYHALRRLFAQAPVPIAVLRGSDLVCVLANRASLKLTGGRKMAGHSLFAVLPELAGNGCDRLLHEVMSSGIARAGKEIVLGSPGAADRHDTYWTFSCAPLHTPEQRHRDVIVVFTEVTDQVIARRALRQLVADAAMASRAKDEFLAMLSHELRNPLARIVTALELMRRQGSEMREQAAIERQVGILTRMVNDLLDVTRRVHGQVELRKRPTELVQIVRAAIDTVSPQLTARRQLVAIDVPTGIRVDVDADRMSQVLSNLLTNASTYSPDQSAIRVTATCGQGKVRLAIVDRGMGIAADLLEHVFDVFARYERESRRRSGGLGLGLAIVRKLVELHGGRVRAFSKGPGTGTEFVIELPACDTADPDQATPAPES